MKNLTKIRASNISRLTTVENCRYMIQGIIDSNPLTDEELMHFEKVKEILSDDYKLWRRANFYIHPDEKDQYII